MVFSACFQSRETNEVRWWFDGAMSVDDRQSSGHRVAYVTYDLKHAESWLKADGRPAEGRREQVAAVWADGEGWFREDGVVGA